MLKSLKVCNIESWKKAEIFFDKGANTLIGKSNHGKSALLRAMFLIFFNRPLGDGMMSWWADNWYAKATFDDSEIKRLKNKTHNGYTDLKTEYFAIGSKVPPEILKQLRINKEINIQTQADPVFLLASSPQEIAEHWNKVARLDKIDTSIQSASLDLKRTTREEKENKAKIATKKEQLKIYEPLNQIEILLTGAQEIETNIGNTKHLIENLKQRCTEIRKLQAKLKIKPLLNTLLLKIEETAKISQGIADKKQNMVKLDTQIHLYREYEALLKGKTKDTLLLKLSKQAIQYASAQSKKKAEHRTLQNKHTLWTGLKDQIKYRKEEIERDQKLFTKELGKECPLCNTILNV